MTLASKNAIAFLLIMSSSTGCAFMCKRTQELEDIDKLFIPYDQKVVEYCNSSDAQSCIDAKLKMARSKSDMKDTVHRKEQRCINDAKSDMAGILTAGAIAAKGYVDANNSNASSPNVSCTRIGKRITCTDGSYCNVIGETINCYGRMK